MGQLGHRGIKSTGHRLSAPWRRSTSAKVQTDLVGYSLAAISIALAPRPLHGTVDTRALTTHSDLVFEPCNHGASHAGTAVTGRGDSPLQLPRSAPSRGSPRKPDR